MSRRQISRGAALAVLAWALSSAAQAGAVAGTASQCRWDRPGHNPFMGDVVAAVDAYTDIPAATRIKLKRRMAARQYDEIAIIRRDSIDGQARYAPEIRDMHWGRGLCRGPVQRSAWPAGAAERGLVYCEDGHCILVPTVCRNVSRITRLEGATPRQAQPGPRTADDGPIDISPSAGGWGAPADHAATGPGLRLPAWTTPLEVAQSSPAAGPLLVISQPKADGTAAATAPPGWMDRPLLDLTPQPAPLILLAPTPPVPELATWAQLAAGLAAVLFIATRARPARTHE